jgi:glutathione S-transferase
VLALTVFSEATFGSALNPMLATKFLAPDSEKANWVAGFMEQRCGDILVYAAAMLGDGPYFAGDRFTIADIAMSASFGMWAGGLGKPLPPKLEDYQLRLAERPAYQRAFARARGEH